MRQEKVGRGRGGELDLNMHSTTKGHISTRKRRRPRNTQAANQQIGMLTDGNTTSWGAVGEGGEGGRAGEAIVQKHEDATG